ncbi:PREDICTED: uncharacterized protein LOC109582434 isoform X2 [Amphimedon queenslandica]|uniref:Uncharacterized protein n=1 Tax=Amphimedon queenslandica TaxID=400682 RepID=A0AAN0J7M6_AMPQE|nr:PREDICTED: uncharacterized protein LOC109582434 isoform X2 [Amphimedon queenslandica]|eukprot:XP_019852703.1 PREDICTED: uncharacterized protein LOC109582434 isoform X2 [Amphimedon queenslandica]
MSSKISRKRTRDKTSPITKFFGRSNIGSIKPLKRERASSRERSPKPKVLMAEEKKAWSSSLVRPSLGSVMFISETRAQQSGLPEPKKRRCSMSLKEVLSSCDSSYDEAPPYERDLELLVIANGLVPLTTSQVDDVHLFNTDQMSRLNLLLTEFFSVSMRLNESIDYAMMNNTPYCMIPGESMIKLWTIVTEVKADAVPDDQMYHLVVEYFQSLVTTHPPTQSSVVREQYLLFLRSIKSSFVSLLISKEKWKVELLSVIVSLLLSDYYHLKNKESSLPLFVPLFWKEGVNLINSDIRGLIQTSVDVYKTQDSSIKSLQMDILTQLFFLIYTECEDLKSDLSIAFSSLSPHSLVTAVSSLRPLKLRDYMYTRNSITLPDSFTHQSMDIYLLINSSAS